MLEYTRNKNGQFLKDGHTMFSGDVLNDLKRMAYLETLYAKEKEMVTCPMVSCDFEDNTIQIEVPESIIKEGFHGGSVLVDFSGVQD